ncbi:MAG TPA: hypothetical protein PKD55_25370 [Bellilinea sp.]|nr:hypothetical protein [Bellilinea sp.]
MRWVRLEVLIAPKHPSQWTGEPPVVGVQRMLCIYILQQLAPPG